MNPAIEVWSPLWFFNVFARVGAVAWKGQAIEDTLAKLISVFLHANEPDAIAKAESALSARAKRTLGQLFEELRKKVDLPPELERQIELFVQERNWVIHHSYIDTVKNIRSASATEQINKRIEQTDLLGNHIQTALWHPLASLNIASKQGVDVLRKAAEDVAKGWSDPSARRN